VAAKKSTKVRKGKLRDSDRAAAARAVARYNEGDIDGDVLRHMLDTLARYGTLDVIRVCFEAEQREWECRMEFQRLRAEGKTADEAIANIVSDHDGQRGWGERTVRGIVYSKLDAKVAVARLRKKYR